MQKPATLFVSFTLLFATAWSQNITNKNGTVRDTVASIRNGVSIDLPLFTSADNAEKIIDRIMDVLGLEPNFKIKTANVPNVQADIRHHQRYILYNPDFISQVNKVARDKWASIFILAHEIGHHLNGHTLLGVNSRPEIELEADQFAGFALCKMGATLEQAQLAMHFIANIEASKTHPARIDRLMAIEKGWDKAEAQMKGVVYVPQPGQQKNITTQN